MKRPLLTAGVTALAVVAATTFLLHAQTTSKAQLYEVAIVKWDGPDKLEFNTPQKSEVMHLFKTGVTLPRDIHDEEFCLAWAANKLAAEGWEPVNLDSRRMVMRRAVSR